MHSKATSFIAFLFLSAELFSTFALEENRPPISTVRIQTGSRLLERGNKLYRRGNFSGAVIIYRKAEKRESQADITAFNIGNCLFQLGKMPEAAAAFRKSVRLSDGDYAPALFNLAAVLYRLKQYGESIAAYHRALKKDPENLSGWLYLSEAAIRAGDPLEAQKALEKAALLDSTDLSIVYQLAEVHVSLYEYYAAVALVRAAYERHPEETDFLFYIGDLLRLAKDNELAAAAYREGLSFRPEDVDALYKLADVLALDGENFLAMDILARILKIRPDFSDAAIFLGNLATDVGWNDRARLAYVQAAKVGNNEGIQGLRNLALDAEKDGNRKLSLDLTHEALRLSPNHFDLLADLDALKNE